MTASTSDLRLTPQRRAVLSVLSACTDHPTAAELIDRVRRVQPGIGAATVYRALGRLVETGQALELQLDGTPAARYDANTHPHDHLLCTSCGAAADVAPVVPESVRGPLAARSGWELGTYDLTYFGLCPSCQTAPHDRAPEKNPAPEMDPAPQMKEHDA